MRGISFLVGMAAAAFMASAARSASTTSLVAECQRIVPPRHACVLGRVMNDHTILVLVTTLDLPTDRPAVWASKAAASYRRIPALDRYAGMLVMVSGDWSDGALFDGRLLMIPTYTRRKH
jgi:hypothetical protein